MRDDEHGLLTLNASDDSTLDELRGHSITYRIALGPHAGRKALTLRTLPSSSEFEQGLARANGFSLHAGVVAGADERDKLERLCRYITRPAVSTERLSLTAQGLIHYRLKTPYRDGTTQVVLLRASCPSPFALRPSGQPSAVQNRSRRFCRAFRFYGQARRLSAGSARQPHTLPRGH